MKTTAILFIMVVVLRCVSWGNLHLTLVTCRHSLLVFFLPVSNQAAMCRVCKTAQHRGSDLSTSVCMLFAV